MSAIDPWAEIARLQKELDTAVAYHDECAKMIEDALDTDARKYNDGGSLFRHYASDIHRIRSERDEIKNHNHDLRRAFDLAQAKVMYLIAERAEKQKQETLDLPLACPHCKKLLGYNVALTEAGEQR